VRSALLQTETGRPPCGITVTLLFDERDKEMSLAPSSGVSPNPRAHGWICSAAPVLTASAPRYTRDLVPVTRLSVGRSELRGGHGSMLAGRSWHVASIYIYATIEECI
jgi:hypothetical protein